MKKQNFAEDILEKHMIIRLFIDVMYVNTIPFLYTMSQHLKLRTSEHVKNREKENLMLTVKGAMHVHSSNGFSVEAMDGDL